MSLINKLLNDLETRQAYTNEDNDNVLVGLSSSHEITADEPDFSRLVPYIKMLLLVAVFATLIYQLQARTSINRFADLYAYIDRFIHGEQQRSRVTGSLDVFQLDSNISLPVTAVAAKTDKNQLRQIAFEPTLDGVDVVLHLSSASRYRVYSLQTPHRLVVELDQAALSFPVDQLEPVKMFSRIRAEQLDDERLRLTLESDAALTIGTISNQDTELAHVLQVSVSQDMAVAEMNSGESRFTTKAVAITDDVKEESTSPVVFRGEVIKTPVINQPGSVTDDIYVQALADFKSRRLVESMSQLQAILEIEPLHVKARMTLALIYFQQGDTGSARTILEYGLQQQPEQIDWLTLYAKVLLKEGNLDDAASVVERVKPTVADHADYYAIKAAIQQKMDNHEVAARVYRDLLKHNGANAAYWMGLGISLEALDRYNDALYAYEQAIRNQTLVGQSRQFVRDRFDNLTAMMNDKSS